MKALLFLITSLLPISASAQSAPKPPPPAETVPGIVTANGERFDIPKSGFTIVPPTGWQVIRGAGGASLLFQGPKPPDSTVEFVYQPNIAVRAFMVPKPIDDITRDEIGTIIVESNSKLSNRYSNYSLRGDPQKIALANGQDAYLYYTSFTYDSTPMIQVHVLAGNARNHFVVTYTDLAKLIEAENSPALATAYAAMVSMEMDSLPPNRFEDMIKVGVGIGGFIVLLIVFYLIRRWRVSRLDAGIDEYDSKGSSDDDMSVSSVTQIDESAVSEMKSFNRSSSSKKSRSYEEEDEAEVEAEAEAEEYQPAPPPPPRRPEPPKPKVSTRTQTKISAPPPTAPGKDRFETRKRKDMTMEDEVPVSEAAPLSTAWNLAENPEYVTQIEDISAVESFQKEERTASSFRPPNPFKETPPDEVSEVARISEMLPRGGEDPKAKKKGFFSWGKKDKDEDDTPKPKKSIPKDNRSLPNLKKQAGNAPASTASQPMSEAFGDSWDLKGGGNAPDDDDD